MVKMKLTKLNFFGGVVSEILPFQRLETIKRKKMNCLVKSEKIDHYRVVC